MRGDGNKFGHDVTTCQRNSQTRSVQVGDPVIKQKLRRYPLLRSSVIVIGGTYRGCCLGVGVQPRNRICITLVLPMPRRRQS